MGCSRHAGHVSHLFRHSDGFRFIFCFCDKYNLRQEGSVLAHSAREDVARQGMEDMAGEARDQLVTSPHSISGGEKTEVRSDYKTSKPHSSDPVSPTSRSSHTLPEQGRHRVSDT